MALGLTNLLIRRLVAKGYVKVAGMGSRHIRYLMTSSGWEALAQATRQSLENTVHLYTQTREQIRSSLSAISERCDMDGADVAEIAYVRLQSTGSEADRFLWCRLDTAARWYSGTGQIC